MKNKLFGILLLLGCSPLSLFAQDKAILPECAGQPYPVECTRKKIEQDLAALLTPEMSLSVRGSAGDHFFVQYALIIDGEGNMIPEQTEIICEIPAFKAAILDYSKNLPRFNIPDELKTLKEKRTLYYIPKVFIWNTSLGQYEVAEKERLETLGIKTPVSRIGSVPEHRDCAGTGDAACTAKKVTDYFSRKFNPPALPNGTYRFIVSFVVGTDGEIAQVEVSDKRFTTESIRVMNKFPDFVPAMIHGLPLRARYRLPVTINIR